jgi:hypothetical protein
MTQEILHRGNASLNDLKDGVLAMGMPIGMDSHVYYVDFANGNDGDSG